MPPVRLHSRLGAGRGRGFDLIAGPQAPRARPCCTVRTFHIVPRVPSAHRLFTCRTAADPPCFTPDSYEYQTLNMVGGFACCRDTRGSSAGLALLNDAMVLTREGIFLTHTSRQGLDTYINILMARVGGGQRALLWLLVAGCGWLRQLPCAQRPCLELPGMPCARMHPDMAPPLGQPAAAGEGAGAGGGRHVSHHREQPPPALHRGGASKGGADVRLALPGRRGELGQSRARDHRRLPPQPWSTAATMHPPRLPTPLSHSGGAGHPLRRRGDAEAGQRHLHAN